MDEIELLKGDGAVSGVNVEGFKRGARLMVPLSMGQMLDRAFRLYRQNFLLFVGVIAPIQIVSALVLMLQAAGGAIAVMAATLGVIVNSVLSLIASGALVIVASRAYFGELLTVGEVYGRVKEEIGGLLLAVLASIVAGMALGLWWVVGIVVGWISGLGMLFFFGACVAPLLIPIVILEEKDAFKALRRGWDLTRRRFWPVLGYAFLLNIMAQLIVTGPILLATFGGQAAFGVGSSMPIILQSLATLVIGILFTPFSISAYLILYFDLRVRTEGVDIEMQTAAQSGTYKTPLAVFANSPAAEEGNWITGSEFGYFVLLSVGFGILFFGFAAVIGFGAMAAAGQFGF